MCDSFFTQDSINFLAELRAHNNREWFSANKARSEQSIFGPARELVYQVGLQLRKLRPNIVADPRVDRSIYRMNRDTRFSRDKTPYKEHLAIWWWEGPPDRRLESPGFYFHLTPDGWIWSVGCYRFAPEGLDEYRRALSAPATAKAFKKIVDDLSVRGLVFSPPELKRIPKGFAPDHPLEEWLRHKGLYTWTEPEPHPAELFTPEAPDFIMSRFRQGLELHRWLAKRLL